MNYNNCGFCTIAYGEYYHRLAYQLLLSYKYHNKTIPFALITDEESEYTKYFDKVILKKPFVSDKKDFNIFWLDVFCPYDKTIFIEADSLVFRNISHLFDALGNKDERVCFGINHQPGNYNLFDLDLARKDFPELEDIANLEPAVLYVSKTKEIQNVYKTARNLFLNGKNYNYLLKTTEPILSLALCINKIKCQQLDKFDFKLKYSDKPVITFYRTVYAYKFSRFSIRANIKKHVLKMRKYDYDIMHFSTGLTKDYTYKYIYYRFTGGVSVFKLIYYRYKDLLKNFKDEIKKKLKPKKF